MGNLIRGPFTEPESEDDAYQRWRQEMDDNAVITKELHALALKTAQEWCGHDGPAPSLVHAIKDALAKLQERHEAERTAAAAEATKFFDESQWSSVIVEPSLWWRIKAVFIRPTIIFVWGQDRYMLRGFKGEWRFSCGGVPTEARKDIERFWRTK